MSHNTASNDRLGTTVAGRYEVVNLLSDDGLAQVFEARDRESGARVALKMLSRRAADASSVGRRLVDEARGLQSVEHPAAMRVLDVGEDADKTPFLVVELLEGERLRDRIARLEMLSRDEALRVVKLVLECLAEAHSRGVLHRDLNPGRIWLCHRPEGRDAVKVIGWGIGKRLRRGLWQDKQDVTTLIGEPAYAAPEVLRGMRPSPASDVYAMGLILGEMLTGARVVTGRSVEAVVRHQVAVKPLVLPPPIAAHALAPIVERAIAKRPGDRYADAAEMLRGLAQAPAARSGGRPAAEAPRRSHQGVGAPMVMTPGVPPIDSRDLSPEELAELQRRPTPVAGVPVPGFVVPASAPSAEAPEESSDKLPDWADVNWSDAFQAISADSEPEPEDVPDVAASEDEDAEHGFVRVPTLPRAEDPKPPRVRPVVNLAGAASEADEAIEIASGDLEAVSEPGLIVAPLARAAAAIADEPEPPKVVELATTEEPARVTPRAAVPDEPEAAAEVTASSAPVEATQSRQAPPPPAGDPGADEIIVPSALVGATHADRRNRRSTGPLWAAAALVLILGAGVLVVMLTSQDENEPAGSAAQTEAAAAPTPPLVVGEEAEIVPEPEPVALEPEPAAAPGTQVSPSVAVAPATEGPPAEVTPTAGGEPTAEAPLALEPEAGGLEPEPEPVEGVGVADSEVAVAEPGPEPTLEAPEPEPVLLAEAETPQEWGFAPVPDLAPVAMRQEAIDLLGAAIRTGQIGGDEQEEAATQLLGLTEQLVDGLLERDFCSAAERRIDRALSESGLLPRDGPARLEARRAEVLTCRQRVATPTWSSAAFVALVASASRSFDAALALGEADEAEQARRQALLSESLAAHQQAERLLRGALLAGSFDDERREAGLKHLAWLNQRIVRIQCATDHCAAAELYLDETTGDPQLLETGETLDLEPVRAEIETCRTRTTERQGRFAWSQFFRVLEGGIERVVQPDSLAQLSGQDEPPPPLVYAVTVHVRSDPPRARVYLGRETIGRTPFDGTLESFEPRIVLVVRKRDHEEAILELDMIETDLSFDVTLTPRNPFGQLDPLGDRE